MKTIFPSRFAEYGALLLIVSWPVVSGVVYRRQISPGDAVHLAEFDGKIPRKASVRVFESRAGTLMEFKGFLPSLWLLVVPPSARPSYYFDETGRFVGWVDDPGDKPTPEQWHPVGKVEVISYDEAMSRIAKTDG